MHPFPSILQPASAGKTSLMFSDYNITRRYSTTILVPIDISNTRHSCLQEKFLFPRLLSEDSIPQHIQRLLKGFSKKKMQTNNKQDLYFGSIHIAHLPLVKDLEGNWQLLSGA